MLVTKHLSKRRSNVSYRAFTTYVSNNFLDDPTLPRTMTPSDYVIECWHRYKNQTEFEQTQALNGKMFELVVETTLYREDIIPFYTQAKANLIPDVDYDIILYDNETDVPITLSIKTSTRERYKQAALEAAAFKNVHRTSINYLLMLYSDEYISVSNKIQQNKILGLDNVIAVDRSEFDSFISELKNRTYGLSPTVTLFEGNAVV